MSKTENLPAVASCLALGQDNARSLIFQQGLPHGCRGPSTRGILHGFPRCISSALDGKWSRWDMTHMGHMGCWCCEQLG